MGPLILALVGIAGAIGYVAFKRTTKVDERGDSFGADLPPGVDEVTAAAWAPRLIQLERFDKPGVRIDLEGTGQILTHPGEKFRVIADNFPVPVLRWWWSVPPPRIWASSALEPAQTPSKNEIVFRIPSSASNGSRRVTVAYVDRAGSEHHMETYYFLVRS